MVKSIDMNAEKKKVILTLCKVFPVTHRQAGKPTEFGKHLQEGVKIHTVRGNNKNLWDQRVDQIKAGKKYLTSPTSPIWPADGGPSVTPTVRAPAGAPSTMRATWRSPTG